MKKAGKISLLLALTLVLVLGLAVYAWTQPMGMGMGKGMGCGPGRMGHMMNLTPEQAGKLFDLKEKFRTDTANLRKNLLMKRLEMKALWKAENPDEKAILAKLKEISPLREQMMEKMVSFRLEARKIAPQAHSGMHMGMGMGMGGGFEMAMGEGPSMECPGPDMDMGPGMMPPPAPPAATTPAPPAK